MSEAILRQEPGTIEGIGKAFEAALKSAGIATIADLLRSTPARIERIVPRASMRQVQGWFSAAWLMVVDGVDRDLAEALTDAGIPSVNELADAGLQTLERAVKSAHERRRIREAPSLYDLAAIQRRAGRLRGTAILVGRVLEKDSGQPVEGATLRAAGETAISGADGAFHLVGLPAGLQHVTVEDVAGRRSVRFTLTVKSGAVVPAVTVRIGGGAEARPRRVIRESTGGLVWLSRGTRLRFIPRPLGELQDGTYVQVREISRAGTARLIHLSRTQVGREIQADRVEVAAQVLPAGADVGDVLQLSNGRLALTSLTLRDVATRKLEAALGHAPLRMSRRPVRRKLFR